MLGAPYFTTVGLHVRVRGVARVCCGLLSEEDVSFLYVNKGVN